MTYLKHTSFDKQKKSAKNILLSKIKVAILQKWSELEEDVCETLYAQPYSADFGVYYDIVDPIVRSTKNFNI